jgi:hypothetical protein
MPPHLPFPQARHLLLLLFPRLQLPPLSHPLLLLRCVIVVDLLHNSLFKRLPALPLLPPIRLLLRTRPFPPNRQRQQPLIRDRIP